jgi:[ribosomal protein S5]-alanine N-acetyltransferase
MRRKDREITDSNELRAAFGRFKVCRLGLMALGKIRVFPMCYGHREGYLYFHSSYDGEKVTMMRENPSVAFEMGRILQIVGTDDILYESLMGTGTVEFIENAEGKAEAIAILLRSFSGTNQEISPQALAGTCIFRVRILTVSMKRNPASWEKPVLETRRLTLRTFRAEDAEQLQAAANHAEISAGTAGVPFPYTIEDARSFIQSGSNDFLGSSGGVLAVIEKESGMIVGCVGINPVAGDRAEIGYWMTPKKWNMGYCSEAVARLIEYGFNEMGLNRIAAMHFPENPASGRVLKKAGMQMEGTLRQYLRKGEDNRDVVVWSVLRNRENGG